VKKDGDSWLQYLQKKAPGVHVKAAQRWMQLAQQVQLDKFPDLTALGQTRLSQLCKLAGKNKCVGSFLEEHGFELDFDPEDQPSVNDFKKKLDEFLWSEKSEKKNATQDTTDEDSEDGEETSEKSESSSFKRSAEAFIKDIDVVLKDETKLKKTPYKEVRALLEALEEKLSLLKKRVAAIKKGKKLQKAA
jgi:hypothetical protein